MLNRRNFIIGAVVLLAILALIGYNTDWFGAGGGTTPQKAGTEVKKEMTFGEKVIQLNDAYQALETKFKSLEQKYNDLAVRFDDCCAKKTASTGGQTTPKKVVPKKETPKPVVTDNNVPEEAPPNIKEAKLGLANLDYLRQDGKITWCAQINGNPKLHFPQYAQNKGAKFTATNSNLTKDGNNWVVEPVPDIEGDYGITEDGVFFIKIAMIKQVLALPISEDDGITDAERVLKEVYYKGTYGGWRKILMTEFGDYYILETAPQ